MNPNVWGPIIWNVLNEICYKYDLLEERKKQNVLLKGSIKSFFQSLQFILPCSKCRKSYIFYQDISPLNFNVSLTQWIYHIHNNVNSKRDTDVFNSELKFDIFVKRLNSYTEIASESNIIDIIFIISFPYIIPQNHTPEQKQNRLYMFYIFLKSYIQILDLMIPEKKNLKIKLQKSFYQFEKNYNNTEWEKLYDYFRPLKNNLSKDQIIDQYSNLYDD